MAEVKKEEKKTEEKPLSFAERIGRVQLLLKAPKSKYNKFGDYNYRNTEDILEAVKPLLAEYKIYLTISDDITQIGDRYYVKAVATLSDMESARQISTQAYAREALEKKKSDDAQITGAASSYARKYALNGLFLIDDTKDPDTDEYTAQNAQANSNASGGHQANTGAGRSGNAVIAKKYADALEDVLAKHPNIKQWALTHFKVDSIAKLTNSQYNEVVAAVKKNAPES